MNKWILFSYHVARSSQSLRVKVWRLLKRYGAVLFKNTVYILPYSKEHEEMILWLCKNIKDSGGEASSFITESLDKEQDDEIIKTFQELCDREYCGLIETCESFIKKVERVESTQGLTESTVKGYRKKLLELTKMYAEIKKVDFFQSPQRVLAEKKLQRLQEKLEILPEKSGKEKSKLSKVYHVKDYLNKKWVTREDVYIDRIASAWFIKKFIDAKAQFVFVKKNARVLPKNTIPFDMYGSEFTHHGEDCTLEAFLKAFQINDVALQHIAEIVHDIDLKDEKYGREEAEGIERVIDGMCLKLKNDNARLEKGLETFDSLYAFYSKEK
ncbi:MAG: chromate resistance protein [Candidatus Kuenenia sp.]|nr:chromate resistance protein [Candidatus Kuenenia hertensis]